MISSAPKQTWLLVPTQCYDLLFFFNVKSSITSSASKQTWLLVATQYHDVLNQSFLHCLGRLD